jgi:hypothetical protein
LLSRNYCKHADRLDESFRGHGLDVDRGHETSSERDLIELVQADIGVAVMPRDVGDSRDLEADRR